MLQKLCVSRRIVCASKPPGLLLFRRGGEAEGSNSDDGKHRQTWAFVRQQREIYGSGQKAKRDGFFFLLDNSHVFPDCVGIHSRNASSPAV